MWIFDPNTDPTALLVFQVHPMLLNLELDLGGFGDRWTFEAILEPAPSGFASSPGGFE